MSTSCMICNKLHVVADKKSAPSTMLQKVEFEIFVQTDMIHPTVLLLLNPALNLTFSLPPITSSHSYASVSDFTCGNWRFWRIEPQRANLAKRGVEFRGQEVATSERPHQLQGLGSAVSSPSGVRCGNSVRWGSLQHAKGLLVGSSCPFLRTPSTRSQSFRAQSVGHLLAMEPCSQIIWPWTATGVD